MLRTPNLHETPTTTERSRRARTRRVATAAGVAGATWAIIHQRSAAVRSWQDQISPLGGRRIRIGAHSMGGALALRWAAANPDRVDRVVCLGPPIYQDADAARSALGELGLMGRSLILDDRIARAIRAFNFDTVHERVRTTRHQIPRSR